MAYITSSVTGGVLTIFLSGRIYTANADAVEAEINAARSENEHTSVVLDAEKLEYSTSSGLRVVLRLRKAEPALKIINVSSELYEIFEMTGFTEMLPVERAMRKLSVEGCEVIGRGAKGTVYRYDPETIVKVYKNPDSLPDIKNERELARRAFVLGIPTAIPYDIVRVGKSYGSVFELLNAKTFSKLIVEHPEQIDAYVGQFASLLRQIHETPVKKDDVPDVKIIVRKWIVTAAAELPAPQTERLTSLVDAVPDVNTLLHCDYHTNNIMMQNGETLLIDMDTLSRGHAVFELANVYITYVGFGVVDPGIVESFMGMPYELTSRIWREFLPKYLQSDDPAYIKSVSDKVELMSSVRLLHHVVRRGITDDVARQTVSYCKDRIAALLDTVDTLDF